jgi:threonine dehydratase
MQVTLKDIYEAAEAIRGRAVDTPCLYSHFLSEMTGAQVILKLENHQVTASFKDRGALVKLLSLTPEQRSQGVIAMSAGNHAQAVAYHARRLGIPAVMVMPRLTPGTKMEHTRAFGAEVILYGEGLREAGLFARKMAEERGYSLVHPYDDPKIIAGQGTIALEMLAAYPDLEVLIVPVGGGGLIAGMAVAVKGIRPSVKIFGVETARFPSMLRALQGAPPEYGTSTIAEGIAIKEPGRITLPIVRQLVEEMLLVEEDWIEQAVLLFLDRQKTVVEGAGAVGLAALLKYRDRFTGRRVGLVISGGNIDLSLLSSIIQRALVRSGRLVRLHADMRDIPGTLADAARLISGTGANIVQIAHQRTFTHLPLQSAEVEFMIQTRNLDHVQQVINSLRSAGYKVRLSDTDGEINTEPDT